MTMKQMIDQNNKDFADFVSELEASDGFRKWVEESKKPQAKNRSTPTSQPKPSPSPMVVKPSTSQGLDRKGGK